MKTLLFLLFGALIITGCTKGGNQAGSGTSTTSGVITNNYTINVSATYKNYDSVSFDVDNDHINDFTIIAYNSAYDGYKEPRTLNMCYIHSLKDSSLIAITNQFANSYWARLYNFGVGSLYVTYAGSFSAGSVIGSNVEDFSVASKYATITNAYLQGNNWLTTSSYIYENSPPYTYNESIGKFLNTTQYIGFSMRKADGRHYGWIKISNGGSCLNASVIQSQYSNSPNQSVTAN